MTLTLESVDNLVQENQMLLNELEVAYRSMERILEQSAREKEIAYSELEEKFVALERLYRELSTKENLLIHLEKLSSIGQFIAEIIHELQSPLTAISAHAELAMMLEPTEAIRKELEEISRQVMRMSGYLRRFRAMAYKGQESFRVFDLNETVVDAIAMMDIIKPNDMEIETKYAREPLLVKGDPYQISQIFLNLAKNAFDAMASQGTRLQVTVDRISASGIRETDRVGEVGCQPQGVWEQILEARPEFALVEFRDQGPGIPPQILQDVFEAFFTTKGRGKGTGLGLSISSDIAKRHGGNLTVKSTLGEGTTFQLLIPLASEDGNSEAM